MTDEVRMARAATLASLAAAPVVLVLAFAAAGGKGVLGAAFGLALAVAFFSATLLAVGAAGRVSVDLLLPAALLTFTVKIAAIGMLLFLLRNTTAFSRWSPGPASTWPPRSASRCGRASPLCRPTRSRRGRGDRFARP